MTLRILRRCPASYSLTTGDEGTQGEEEVKSLALPDSLKLRQQHAQKW